MSTYKSIFQIFFHCLIDAIDLLRSPNRSLNMNRHKNAFIKSKKMVIKDRGNR